MLPRLGTIVLLILLFLNSTIMAGNYVFAMGGDPGEGDKPVLYYFWGHCPTCTHPEKHVGLFDHYPIEVEIYEVFHDPEGRRVYEQMCEKVGIESYGFPTLVLGSRYWLGFSDSVQQDILETIEAVLYSGVEKEREDIVRLPLLGEIDLAAAPILLTTVIIASLDGINPCSLFVLTFLLAIIVHSASRRKILIIGLTFLLVTASVYGLFILGILNIMIFVSSLFWIRNFVAALVIFLGLVSIKDFLFPARGISFSIPDSYKSRFYRQVRKIFYSESALPAILATILMAVGISIVELPCTAGLPFIWSTIVSTMDLSMSYFLMLFFIYIFFYLLIELLIFFVAVIRLRSIKLTEERGQFLKLVAGSMMVTLGLILLVAPDLMENIFGIVITLAASVLILSVIYYGKRLARI